MVSIEGKPLGVIGVIKPGIAKKFKLPAHSGGFEVDVDLLAKIAATGSAYKPLSKFPSTEQDVTLEVATDTRLNDLQKELNVQLNGGAITADVVATDAYSKDSKSKNLTFP